jgi:hypothetical protein
VTYYLCLLTATAMILSGCTIGVSQSQEENTVEEPAQMVTFEGKNKTLGNETAYSWVTLDSKGNLRQ